MKKLYISALLLLGQLNLWSQNDNKMTTLPYREIPAYPESYTAESIVARMIDGLGFRFYWATEGLRSEDLAFRPTPEARSSEETIDHILGLSTIALNALKDQPNVRSGEETSPLTFEVKRKKTLEILQEASNMLKQKDAKIKDHNMVFQNGANKTEFPFWNLINGPIADALWHVGQVVSFRRSSGNPFNAKASVLTGKVRE